ncbi:MAG: tol-pal system-associated acyl-CoA thioesterase [Candidatus Competibacteraceae bacterium]
MSHFIWPVRVYYEDTDSAGVVYYANYLKFMERARTEWLRSRGYEQDTLAREAGIQFMVRSVDLHYRRPARFNDLLQVNTWVEEIKKASLLFAQAIFRSGEDEQSLCNGHIRVACVAVDSLKPKAIPPLLLAEIAP